MEFNSINVLRKESKLILESLKADRISYTGPEDEDFNKWRKSLKKTGIFAIFIDNHLFYIGKSKTPSTRLKEHFILPSDGGYTKNHLIDECLRRKNKIEASFQPVPGVIYSSIEELIIKKEQPHWNYKKS